MKRKNVYRKLDNEIVYCKGTDIPPTSFRLFFLFGHIYELIQKKECNILSMDEIFDGYTYTKSQRFQLISSLIKNKFVNRTKIDNLHDRYEIIPKISFRNTTGMLIYKPENNNQRLEIMKELNEARENVLK